jgi:hypothetical protein
MCWPSGSCTFPDFLEFKLFQTEDSAVEKRPGELVRAGRLLEYAVVGESSATELDFRDRERDSGLESRDEEEGESRT